MSAVLGYIGSRWQPGHVERRDTSTGFYECVNSPHHSRSERDIQRLLLTPTKEEIKEARQRAQQ